LLTQFEAGCSKFEAGCSKFEASDTQLQARNPEIQPKASQFLRNKDFSGISQLEINQSAERKAGRAELPLCRVAKAVVQFSPEGFGPHSGDSSHRIFYR